MRTALLCSGVPDDGLEGTLVAQSRRVPLWEVREGTVHARLRRRQKYRAGTCAKRSQTQVLQKVPPHPDSPCTRPWGLPSFLIFSKSLKLAAELLQYLSRAWRQGVGNATVHRSQQREQRSERKFESQTDRPARPGSKH